MKEDTAYETAVERIYFLNLGYITVSGIGETPESTTPNGTGPMYAVAIKYSEGIILYDTGVSTDPVTMGQLNYAIENNLVKAEVISPVERLEELGFSTDDVTHVIVSHMHVDHFGNIHQFKNAKVYITEEEYNGSIKAYLNHQLDQTGEMAQVMPERMIKMFLDEGVNFEIMSGATHEILPGVEIYNFGNGHSYGMSALMVRTNHSGNFFVISDIAYTEEELHTSTELSFNVSNQGYNATKMEAISIAKDHHARILTGHDPKLLNSLVWSIDGYYE